MGGDYMKIVNLEELSSMSNGTVFSKIDKSKVGSW